jgi:hypothetical protein
MQSLRPSTVSVAMLRTCHTRKFLSRCTEPAIAVCQFCGREFCAVHGTRYEDASEVCSRPICQTKYADLKAHLEWKKQAVDRSNRGFCAMPECPGTRWGQCSKCLALFCERHLQDRDERIRHGAIVFSRPASMCDHCAARNKLWSKG